MSRTIELLSEQLENIAERVLALPGGVIQADRGNPTAKVLDLAGGMQTDARFSPESKIDCWNYAPKQFVPGLPEARCLMGEVMRTPASNTYVLGHSSVAVMTYIVMRALLLGMGGNRWHGGTFLADEPGYDRHIRIPEDLGHRVIGVPMTRGGIDLDALRHHLANPEVVAMFLSTPYQNPTGWSYSQATLEAMARLPAANPGFRYLVDEAYIEVHLREPTHEFPRVWDIFAEAGTLDRLFVFSSTSKITRAGSGIAAVAASNANLAWLLPGLEALSTGPDKLRQLEHVLFLRDLAGVQGHMRKVRALLRPMFDEVYAALVRGPVQQGLAQISEPHGGYFESVTLTYSVAREAVALLHSAGVVTTSAEAGYAGGKNVANNHLRLAPTSVSDEARPLYCEAVPVAIALATHRLIG